MRQSLLERCEAQVRNETAMRKSAKLEDESLMKLGAMMYANAEREFDAERMKECKRILKEKAGIFSNFRGLLEYVIRVKMSLADDPVSYLDGVMRVYDRLSAGRMIAGELVAMAATTIYENCPQGQIEEVVDKTREAYAKVKERHPFLTGDSDMALIALMVMAGKDADQASDEAEELFRAMKANYKVGSDVAQAVSMVLALSDKPADEKLAAFLGLFNACKEAGHATSKDKAMTIYAAYAGADYDLAEVVAAIGEVDVWLKGQKGYGTFGIGASQRRLFAAALVLEDMQAGSASATEGVTQAVVQAVVEELVLILITIIMLSIIISTSVSNSAS